MNFTGNDFEKTRREYIISNLETLEELERLYVSVENNFAASHLNDIIRELMGKLHSLKGSLASYEFIGASKMLHRSEDIVEQIRLGAIGRGGDLINELFNILDQLRKYFQDYLDGKSVDEDSEISKENISNYICINVIVAGGLFKGVVRSLFEEIKGACFNFYYAKDQQEAISLYQRFQVELIVSSYSMPGGNGIGLIKEIKKISQGREPKILLVATTQLSEEELKIPDGVIPLGGEAKIKVFEFLNTHMKFALNPASEILNEPISKIKRVVYIDDDYDMINLVQLIFLNLPQYNTRYINDTSDIIGQLKIYRPDLILCDLNIPEYDGRKILTDVRNDPDLATALFVFITGEDSPQIKLELKNLGSDGMLSKSTLRKSIPKLLNALNGNKKAESKL